MPKLRAQSVTLAKWAEIRLFTQEWVLVYNTESFHKKTLNFLSKWLSIILSRKTLSHGISHIKVKQPHYRPGYAPRVWGDWGSEISWQLACEDGKVVSPTHRVPLPPRKYPCYSFLLEAETTLGPQCGQKGYVNEKFQWHYGESNPRPPGL